MEIKLRAFPSGDRDFGAFARSALDDLDPPATPERLRRAIRLRYPAAEVRVQHDLARHGEGPVVWYAFRTATLGEPAPGTGTDTGTSPGVEATAEPAAWAILDDERRFVEISPALAEIAELPSRHMLGYRIEDFSNPSDPTIREDIAGMWSEFLRRRSFASTLRFNYADGRPRELAYRIVADADGIGRHRLSVRVL